MAVLEYLKIAIRVQRVLSTKHEMSLRVCVCRRMCARACVCAQYICLDKI